MKKIETCTIKKKVVFCVVAIVLLLVGAFLELVLHELSHLVVLMACGGTATDFIIGTESYVAGFVQSEYISIVALSSIFIPLFLSLATIWVKNVYFNLVEAGFCMANFMNVVMGLCAYVLTTNPAAVSSFDVHIAMRYAQTPTLIFAIICICIIGTLSCLTYACHKTSKGLEKHL